MSIKDRVKNALTKCPELRDNLVWLKQRLWQTDLKKAGRDLATMTAIELLTAEMNEEISNARSIQRWWCKWQEEVPALRGKEWYDRKHIEEPIVREEMKKELNT